MPNLKVKIDVTKLDKSAFFKGAKGTYCDIILWENDVPDDYGNTHSAKQDMGKERKGEKTPYIGNASPFGKSNRSPNQNGATPPQTLAAMDDELDEIPF